MSEEPNRTSDSPAEPEAEAVAPPPAGSMGESAKERSNHQAVPAVYVKNDEGEYVPLEIETISPQAALGQPPDGMVMIARSERMESTFQGPVASPQTIEGYERFYPGAGRLLLNEHLEDKRHARRIEQQEVENEKWGVIRGQILSFLLMGSTIGGSITCALTGHTAEAIALASAPALTALARVLHRSRKIEEGE